MDQKSPPGWYMDFDWPAGERWWDGSQWTSHVIPPPPEPPPPSKGQVPFNSSSGPGTYYEFNHLQRSGWLTSKQALATSGLLALIAVGGLKAEAVPLSSPTHLSPR